MTPTKNPKENISMKTKPLILVIDDELSILKTLKEVLEDEEYQVETLADGNKSIEKLGELVPDLVLLDIFMPNCDGIKLLEKIKREYPLQNVIMMSGFGNIPIAIDSLKKGAIDFIEKPLNLDEILSKINFIKQIKDKKPKESNLKDNTEEYSTEEFGIIGKSYLFKELIQQINLIKNLNFPLLIYGEHGTGKSLFVKYMYETSKFKNKKFVTVNCSSLKENSIIEKINSFYLNSEGIIYIKHINNMPIKAQSFLLDKLETNKNNKKQRIIATTISPLLKAVETSKFNSALFHEINITPLEIPPLSKRKYDIPLLCDYYLKQENKLNDKFIILSAKSIRTLRNHNWIGNVTKLKNLIKYMVKTSDKNDIIDDKDILKYIEEKEQKIIEEQSFTRFNSLKEATDSFEKNFLLHLLKKNRYDINQLSNSLNLTSAQLKEKLLRFKLNLYN